EDGIRGFHVTGVQTCALPILAADGPFPDVLYVEQGVRYRIAVTSIDDEYTLTGVTAADGGGGTAGRGAGSASGPVIVRPGQVVRSEERRVGKEGRGRGGM